MSSQTLEQLLEQDSLGALLSRVQKVQESRESETREELAALDYIREAMDKARADESVMEKIRALDYLTEEGRVAVAELIGVAKEDYIRYFDIQSSIMLAVSEMSEIQTIKQEWDARVDASPMIVLDEPIPDASNGPVVVMYSASWCLPCWLVKPTVLELAEHFDGTFAYYGHDDVLKQIAIGFIPQFVVYFPDGKQDSFGVEETTQELWDALNGAVSLGEMYAGMKGTLKCENGACTIEPQEGE